MSQILSSKEMDEVYHQLGEQGKGDQPYVLEYQLPERLLIFFGSLHSNDPANPQWQQLEAEWRKFLASPNPRKVVFSEGGVRPVDPHQTRGQAIMMYEEPGLLTWLANRANVDITSVEPSRQEEIDYLHTNGFSYEEILAYYLARQMDQWHRSDRPQSPDWHKYLEELVRGGNTLNWGGLVLSEDKLIEIYEQVSGRKFDPEDLESFKELSHPKEGSVSDASGHYRDEKLLAAIKDKLVFYDVFVVYGSGHAIRLKPALNALFNKSG